MSNRPSVSSPARVDALIDELIALDAALNKRSDGCVLAYAIYKDLIGDQFAEDLCQEDFNAVDLLYIEITAGYEVDEISRFFTIAF